MPRWASRWACSDFAQDVAIGGLDFLDRCYLRAGLAPNLSDCSMKC
jgi:hypothetical protein